MSLTNSGFAFPQTPADETEALLHRARAQSTMLKRAFHLCLSRRSDARLWEDLGNAAAAHLLGCGGERSWLVQRLDEADRRFESRVMVLLSRTSAKSGRASHYRRAIDQIHVSATAWERTVGEATAAYWRHAALVWMTLWHCADLPSLTAGQAGECLDAAFAPQASKLTPAHKKPIRGRFSGAAGSFGAALRRLG